MLESMRQKKIHPSDERRNKDNTFKSPFVSTPSVTKRWSNQQHFRPKKATYQCGLLPATSFSKCQPSMIDLEDKNWRRRGAFFEKVAFKAVESEELSIAIYKPTG